jgi:hypothetical protein
MISSCSAFPFPDMNPLPIESALLARIAAIPALAGVTAHTGITADDIPLDESAIVVEVSQLENTLGPLWRATATVSLRSPALAVTRAQHDERWQAVMSSLSDRAFLDAGLAASAQLAAAKIEFAGTANPIGPVSMSTQDRAWLASVELVIGVRSV